MTTDNNLQNKIIQALVDWKTQAIEGAQPPNFKDLSDTFDAYYFLNKLKIYCGYLSYVHIFERTNLACQKEDFRWMSLILQKDEAFMEAYPLFRLYNQIRVLFENFGAASVTTDNLFLEAQAAIYKAAIILDREEVLELYSYLTNYCIKKFNLGYAVYQERLFMVYNDLLNLKYYGQQKKQAPLPPQVYKNLVTYAILLKDHSLFHSLQTILLPTNQSKGFKNGLVWAERFVSIYKSKLDKKFRKSYPSYCAALLSFIQGDYLKAYKQLGNPHHVKGTFINLDTKTLQLRILYEVQEIAPERLEKDKLEIASVLDTFRQRIRYEKTKKKELKYQLDQYIIFYQCFKNLLKFHKCYLVVGQQKY